LTIGADQFRDEIRRVDGLLSIVNRYTQAFLSQVSQQVACNGLHSVEQRCARWLLLTHDRVDADEFPMTHEFLAQMLGVRRASVSVTAGALQRAGFIELRRGRVTITDREGLEGASCECYSVTREVFDRLLP
jgi:CRP-like cAMP-binding protein